MTQPITELFIYGTVYDEPKTGYEIHNISKYHLPAFMKISRSTLYYTLDKLANEKYLKVKVEKKSRVKKYYSITNKGKTSFYNILENLSEYVFLDFVGTVLVFIHKLPKKIKQKIIVKRLAAYENYLDVLKKRLKKINNSTRAIAIKRLEKIIELDKKIMKKILL